MELPGWFAGTLRLLPAANSNRHPGTFPVPRQPRRRLHRAGYHCGLLRPVRFHGTHGADVYPLGRVPDFVRRVSGEKTAGIDETNQIANHRSKIMKNQITTMNSFRVLALPMAMALFAACLGRSAIAAEPPALPPHCAPGRRALQCGPPEITPGCESSPGSPDRKLPPCVAPPGALRPSSPHMYAAGGTAARIDCRSAPLSTEPRPLEACFCRSTSCSTACVSTGRDHWPPPAPPACGRLPSAPRPRAIAAPARLHRRWSENGGRG